MRDPATGETQWRGLRTRTEQPISSLVRLAQTRSTQRVGRSRFEMSVESERPAGVSHQPANRSKPKRWPDVKIQRSRTSSQTGSPSAPLCVLGLVSDARSQISGRQPLPARGGEVQLHGSVPVLCPASEGWRPGGADRYRAWSEQVVARGVPGCVLVHSPEGAGHVEVRARVRRGVAGQPVVGRLAESISPNGGATPSPSPNRVQKFPCRVRVAFDTCCRSTLSTSHTVGLIQKRFQR